MEMQDENDNQCGGSFLVPVGNISGPSRTKSVNSPRIPRIDMSPAPSPEVYRMSAEDREVKEILKKIKQESYLSAYGVYHQKVSDAFKTKYPHTKISIEMDKAIDNSWRESKSVKDYYESLSNLEKEKYLVKITDFNKEIKRIRDMQD